MTTPQLSHNRRVEEESRITAQNLESEHSKSREDSTPLITLYDVVREIGEKAQKYRDDYEIEPFDVCLGPKEFDLIYQNGRAETWPKPPDWHFKLAPMFYKGMRVRLLLGPGVLVGTLTNKKRSEGAKFLT